MDHFLKFGVLNFNWISFKKQLSLSLSIEKLSE